MNAFSPHLPTALLAIAARCWLGQDPPAAHRSRRETSLEPDSLTLTDELSMDDVRTRQVLQKCLQDLAGYPAATLPELAFRLTRQRLLAQPAATSPAPPTPTPAPAPAPAPAPGHDQH